MAEQPIRCSWCFGTFMHNHTPVIVQDESGERNMHKVCADAWKRERNPVWPARTIRSPRDE